MFQDGIAVFPTEIDPISAGITLLPTGIASFPAGMGAFLTGIASLPPGKMTIPAGITAVPAGKFRNILKISNLLFCRCRRCGGGRRERGRIGVGMLPHLATDIFELFGRRRAFAQQAGHGVNHAAGIIIGGIARVLQISGGLHGVRNALLKSRSHTSSFILIYFSPSPFARFPIPVRAELDDGVGFGRRG